MAATFAVACIVALAVCFMQPVSGGGFQLLPPGHGLRLVEFNPELLDFAAPAGERVVVPVGDATSGYTAIVQEQVDLYISLYLHTRIRPVLVTLLLFMCGECIFMYI